MVKWALVLLLVVLLVACNDENGPEPELVFQGCDTMPLAQDLGAKLGGTWACIDFNDCSRCQEVGTDREVLLASTAPSTDPDCTFTLFQDEPEGFDLDNERPEFDAAIAECSALGDAVDGN